ncbi:MAG: low molecular weight phosphotyrosine protein phosphatase [Elusimicrobia bacterium]|nr:low molecular weight phosphotyrosine protein phosphatase [Elusimicrobiota bacterium]
MSAAPRKIMFVCTGNICRSATAEHLLRHWAKSRGLALETASCGTAAESWYEIPEPARRLLAAEGVPPFEHRPRLATRAVLRESDLILAMTQAHFDNIVERFPEFTGRTRLFREQAGFGEQDVEDPMGRPDAVFADCLAVIKESLEALLRSDFRDP